MVTTDAAHQFWTHAERSPYETYEELARAYEENIEYKHPKNLSGRSSAGWCNCSWCATRIKYPTYTGPKVTNIR